MHVATAIEERRSPPASFRSPEAVEGDGAAGPWVRPAARRAKREACRSTSTRRRRRFATRSYRIQAGAFSDQDNARRAAARPTAGAATIEHIERQRA